MLDIDSYPANFEEDHQLRSAFMCSLIFYQAQNSSSFDVNRPPLAFELPKTLIRYWHDPYEIPGDVRDCLASWDHLNDEGFDIRMFDDNSAAVYIEKQYGERHREAFARCRHPAMRSDYLRLSYVFAEGGFYVDADDVLLSDGWKSVFSNRSLKVQPLCYDIPSGGMISVTEMRRPDLTTDDKIFYVNNNPIAAPAGHPVLQRALERATNRLLSSNDPQPEIQETTGPGNMTAALAAYARDTILAGEAPKYELILNWDEIAETRWELDYRNDARNWRHMDGF